LKRLRPALAALFLVVAATAAYAEAVPYVSEMSPLAVAPGAAAFTLTITGTDFGPGATVNWKVGTTTTPLVTTVLSSTQLTAVVPASLVAAAATASVTVVNPGGAPSGTPSNTKFFQVTLPTDGVTFNHTATLEGANRQNPESSAAGDFNGDGKPDLVTIIECPYPCSTGTIAIWLNDGNGTFSAGSPVTFGGFPSWVRVEDFNRDGKPDLAVGGYDTNSTGTISLLLGNGDGTFTPGSILKLRAVPYSVSVADLNGDGNLDLILGQYLDSSISVLLGKGDGTFDVGATVAVDPNGYFFGLPVGDFNGDGKLDVVAGNVVLLGNGDGTFSVKPTGLYGFKEGVVLDVNGDGQLDLVATDFGGGVAMYQGNGDGTFTYANSYPTNVSSALAVGDFNGDGKLDVFVPDEDPYTGLLEAVILFGDGMGGFTVNRIHFGDENILTSIAVADFNGDGRLDVAFASPVSVQLQSPAAEPAVPPSLAFGNQSLGTSNTLPLIIPNAGTAALTITSATVTGTNSSDFTATLNTCSSPVNPGASCSMSVNFAPSFFGAASATLTLTSNAGMGTQSVSLTGTGVGVPTARISPASLTFGNQAKGTPSASQTAILTNIGMVPLAVTNIQVSGNFKQTNNCGTSLPAGSSCQIAITFTPQSEGPLSGILTVTDNSSTSATQTVSLSGTGLGSFAIYPTPASLTVKRGILGGFLLTLKSINGFKGKVSLSCAGGPAGSQCANLPQTVNLNGTAFALSGILFPRNSTPGTYIVTFTGVSGNVAETGTATFIVQ
jgi:FG-GAP-like repeat/Abnormal spindle-like microcephaly-assoc'd, ASPM-SPD-2-Hydin/FG-GAP repeat